MASPGWRRKSRRCRKSAQPNRRASCPELFFLIDPLDGTKEFVAGRNEFTVNVALVVKGTPLLGIIGAPALGLIWRGLVGQGAERLATGQGTSRPGAADPHPALPAPGQPWIAAVSRSHGDAATEAFIDAEAGAVRQTLGSAVKFARVAEGAADIYPRLAPTSEWDIAAGHALVTAAGGKITDRGRARELRFGERARRFHRAGVHRLGRSDGERADAELLALLRQLIFERRPAQRRLFRESAGLAAKASRVSSRPNR